MRDGATSAAYSQGSCHSVTRDSHKVPGLQPPVPSLIATSMQLHFSPSAGFQRNGCCCRLERSNLGLVPRKTSSMLTTVGIYTRNRAIPPLQLDDAALFPRVRVKDGPLQVPDAARTPTGRRTRMRGHRCRRLCHTVVHRSCQCTLLSDESRPQPLTAHHS